MRREFWEFELNKRLHFITPLKKFVTVQVTKKTNKKNKKKTVKLT